MRKHLLVEVGGGLRQKIARHGRAPRHAQKTMSKTKLKKKKTNPTGRPPKSIDEKKKRVTVSVHPKSDPVWAALAQKARISKGRVAEWVACAPEAEECRKALIANAYFFVPRFKED